MPQKEQRKTCYGVAYRPITFKAADAIALAAYSVSLSAVLCIVAKRCNISL